MLGLTNSGGMPALTNAAVAANVLSGKDFIGLNGQRLIGSAPAKTAETITPGTANRILTAGQILTGDQTILGDADLVAANIKKNVNIFGITGTFEGAEPDISMRLSNTNTSGGNAADLFWTMWSGTGGFGSTNSFLPFYMPINKTATCVISWGNITGPSSNTISVYAYRKIPNNQTSSISPFQDTGYSLKMGQAATSNWASPTQVTLTSGGTIYPTLGQAGSATFVIPSYGGASLIGIILVSSTNQMYGLYNARLKVTFS